MSRAREHDLAGKAARYGAIVVAGLVAPYLLPSYQVQMTELWLFVVFALTWDLVGGQMGYNSFGNVVFVGVGVYACAVIQVGLFYDVGAYTAAKGGGTEFTFDAVQFVTGLAFGLPAAAVLAGLAAVVLGSAVLGLRGHYFAICTLGLGIAAGEIAAGWDWLGGGSGMTTPEAPRTLGDIGKTALLSGLRPCGGHLCRHRLAAAQPLRAGHQRHPRR